ncbi:MAG TPA: flagellar export protein FliJ [Burkholderiales bacterium]|nr:flagellar export protein FliJ [Burkholderiales bacterium]
MGPLMSGPATNTDWRRLRGIAEEKRDALAKALSAAIALATGHQRKLDMLHEYQRDYVQRMSHAGIDGIAAERLQNFRRFLAQLERAIDQQRQVVATAHNDVQRAQAALAASQRQVDSFQVLVDRQNTATIALQRREQQKQQDEYASRLLPRFLSGGD